MQPEAICIQAVALAMLSSRHWKKLAESTGSTNAQPTGMTTLFSLLEQKVGEQLEAISAQSDVASKEMSLEKVIVVVSQQ